MRIGEGKKKKEALVAAQCYLVATNVLSSEGTRLIFMCWLLLYLKEEEFSPTDAKLLPASGVIMSEMSELLTKLWSTGMGSESNIRHLNHEHPRRL